MLRPGFPELSVHRMAQLLGVSRSLVYARLMERSSPPFLLAIEQIVQTFLGYGYRRVVRELRRRDIQASEHAVRKAMRECGLSMKRPGAKGITRRNPRAERFANLVKGLKAEAPNRVWVADTTLIRTATGAVYLAAIIDLYSRKVVSWALSRNPNLELCLKCLNGALQSRRPQPGWTHHSDQGSTYTAPAYVAAVRAHAGHMSTSRTGTPTDNAVAESFFRTLKIEEVRTNSYDSFLDLEASLESYIESIYNARRMHSSLGYRSPDEYEALFTGEEG